VNWLNLARAAALTLGVWALWQLAAVRANAPRWLRRTRPGAAGLLGVALGVLVIVAFERWRS
jgi:hypothetical protein